MINCSLCPLGIGQEVISLICSKEDVEVTARKSFMSIWKVKQENSVLREVVVCSSREVLRTDETGDTKFYLGCFIIVLIGSEGNGLPELLMSGPNSSCSA